jgi:uncharacterized protein
MGDRQAYTPGTFCWADVGAPNPEASERFYNGLFGWTAEAMPGYWTLTLDGKSVAGMFPPVEGSSPGWISYVSVESADDTTARARELGASVLIEPRDIGAPDALVGRMALLADPQGAPVALWQAGFHIGAQVVNDVGTMVWNTLSTTDVDAAKSFYGELFGWTTEPFEDDAGDYWNFRNREGWLNGGLMAVQTPDTPPSWRVMFTVLDVQDTVRRARELGGDVLVVPTQTVIGDVAVVHDPAGAAFGLFEGETEP